MVFTRAASLLIVSLLASTSLALPANLRIRDAAPVLPPASSAVKAVVTLAGSLGITLPGGPAASSTAAGSASMPSSSAMSSSAVVTSTTTTPLASSSAAPSAAPSSPDGSNWSAPVAANSTAPVLIPWQACPSDSIFKTSFSSNFNATANATTLGYPSDPTNGVVNSMSILPCERASPDEPCRFLYGANYTISVNFTSAVNSTNARSTVLARDDTQLPSLRYPVSGQSFDGCSYTGCPITANISQIYTYRMNTLLSPFNYLSVTLAADNQMPMFCAGFYAQFVAPASRNSTAPMSIGV